MLRGRPFLCPGYRYDAGEEAWKAVKVFPRWEAMYPEPPDLLGVTRVYEKSVDKPVLKAVQVWCVLLEDGFVSLQQ